MENSNPRDLIYQLDGRPPLSIALPLGLQHVLAMFVGNLAPIFILTGAMSTPEAPFPTEIRVMMIQCAMFVSGLITLVQLYPLKLGIIQVGARLPIVMGTAFAFVPTMQNIGEKLLAENLGPVEAMGYVLGGVLAGTIVEIIMGLFIKPLRKFFPPIVIGAVLITIGIKLLSTGATYFVGGAAAPDKGDAKYWIAGGATFLIIIALNRFGKGMWKATAILSGIVAGYVIASFMGMVNPEGIVNAGWVSFPLPLVIKPLFRWDVIFPFVAIYVVSGLETMGNTSGITIAVFGREANADETAGGILADALGGIVSSTFNTLPNTAFGQNAGIIAMTKVVNRFCVATGAGVLIVAALFPKIGAIFNAMPNCVMGGAVITVFAMIFINGIKMVLKSGINDRNSLILAITMGLGFGVGGLSNDIKANFPAVLQVIFAEPVAAVCIVSILACIILKPQTDAPAPAQPAPAADAKAG